MGAAFALASAIGYGLSDVLGGILSRRAPFLRVALLGQLGGLAATVLIAPLMSTRTPQLPALAWGGVSGIGTGLAMAFLLRGIGRGTMSVVVPISAVGGVLLPVLTGVLVLGERPAPLAWVGIVVAVPALRAVTQTRDVPGQGPSGAGDGIVAGVGIAVQYLALAQAGTGSGLWPVVAGRITATVAIAVVVACARRPDPAPVQRRALVIGGAVVAGVLAGLALGCYLLATDTELVATAVVLASLYPVVPVLLAVTVLRERLSSRQTCGLVGMLAASVLIAVA